MSARGHSRHFGRTGRMSAIPPIATGTATYRKSLRAIPKVADLKLCIRRADSDKFSIQSDSRTDQPLLPRDGAFDLTHPGPWQIPPTQFIV